MNNGLSEVLKIYATQNHKALNLHLLDLSKDAIISLFNELLTTYINDKNSSTLREFITVNLSGYQHSQGKIGYNGYKHLSAIAGKPLMCEAKPKNFDTRELENFKNGLRKSKPSSLNGGGNFTDYTIARFEKDQKENPHLLVSGFVDGKLIYIFEFPFTSPTFLEKLGKQLRKKFIDGDKKNTYLRGASFDYNDFIKCNNLKLNYLLPQDELTHYKNFINRKFYLWMTTKTK